ncbi:hypothetical protein PsorP6_008063 [Peronosclerospora sorghi]|uniref:Uncharacterized protein n=1 Tax=Peronosclerospora sorghi TaxID=230839 RepID=A0ACC0W9V5_9STRA|nr:hypothetical protein PsorP6_008063 [Peronosclerospora sorghi]
MENGEFEFMQVAHTTGCIKYKLSAHLVRELSLSYVWVVQTTHDFNFRLKLSHDVSTQVLSHEDLHSHVLTLPRSVVYFSESPFTNHKPMMTSVMFTFWCGFKNWS